MTGRWLAGVDGCRAGWAVVLLDLQSRAAPVFKVVGDFASVLDDPGNPDIVAVDMPIGLPDHVGPGGRGAESAVRPLLGQRQSSVFSVPSRAAIMETGYEEACRVALETSNPPRKVSKQCFHLFAKIREIDALMIPALESRIYECHPELAFRQLNGERPMGSPKKVKSRVNPEGIGERRSLLVRQGYDATFLDQPLPAGAGRDDLIDAAVLALTAGRIARGEACSFPSVPERDGKGLRIAIWG